MAKREWNKKKSFILSVVLCVPVLCILAVYLYGLNHYQTCFMNGTVIDQIDVSGMTIPQLTQRIQAAQGRRVRAGGGYIRCGHWIILYIGRTVRADFGEPKQPAMVYPAGNRAENGKYGDLR